MFRPKHSSVLAVPVVAAVLLFASACGESTDTPDDENTAATTPTASPTPETSPSPSPTEEAGQVIEITFTGDDVTPQGESVELGVGETLTLEITADAPGELHVHSTPEQEVAYPAGTSEATLVIDRPGVVEVESHDLHKLVLKLEVR